jgi:hypothetical protein
MIGKWFAGLFLAVFFVTFSLAQKSSLQNETQWEFLEVFSVSQSCDGVYYDKNACRYYFYQSSGLATNGPASLDWMSESGWELVGFVPAGESPHHIYFKRHYNKARTEREIAWLKQKLQKDIQGLSVTRKLVRNELVDLDAFEKKQKIDDYNKAEEAKLRAALDGIKDLPLRIVSVSSKAQTIGQTMVGAEIVLDGTSVLLKDGNKYRSSEAAKYFNESINQILEKLNVSDKKVGGSNAGAIASGSVLPVIGEFYFYKEGLTLKATVVVNSQNRENIVAQGSADGKWLSNPQ